jgi:hypothetical protein
MARRTAFSGFGRASSDDTFPAANYVRLERVRVKRVTKVANEAALT